MSGRRSAVLQKQLQCVITQDGQTAASSGGRGWAGDSHPSSSETGTNQELLPLIRPAEHSSTSSGAPHPHPGRHSAPGSETHPSPALGLGPAWGNRSSPTAPAGPGGAGKPSPSTRGRHGIPVPESCAEAAPRPSHLTSMSQSVLHKNILGGGREEEFQTLTFDNKLNPLFFPCFRKEGQSSSSTGWDQAGAQHMELWAVTHS